MILYQGTVEPTDPILDIKGKPYSLREALRDDEYDKTSLVVGIFMTFYDVHVNRIPDPGRVSYPLHRSAADDYGERMDELVGPDGELHVYGHSAGKALGVGA